MGELMTILNPTGKSKKESSIIRKAFFIFLIFFVVLGYHFVTGDFFAEHTVFDDLDGLVYAFSALSYGDVDGFFEGFVDSITVIGLFMVVFALYHFLLAVVMKSMFSNRLATVLAIVLSAYSFINHKIYNYLISLNAFVVAFLVFCAFMIMLWSFGRDSLRGVRESHNELEKARNLAREQYAKDGNVDEDLLSHIRRLKNEISNSKKQYREDSLKFNK